MKRTAHVVALFTLLLYSAAVSSAQTQLLLPPTPVARKFVHPGGQLDRSDLKLPKDLQTIVNGAILPPDLDMQRWVAAQPGAKIVVKQDGMYRVTRTELQNAGFDVNTDSTYWRLFMEGNEQAIIVGAGDQYIEFYGRGLDTPESDSRVYYLIVDAATAGKRIATRVLRPFGGGVVSNNFRSISTRKERTTYISSIRNGDAENYFGTLITSDFPMFIYFPVAAPDLAAAEAIINVRLQGFFTGPHNVQVAINGHSVGTLAGREQESFAGSFTVPAAILVEGTNTLTLMSTGTNDFSFFDTVTLNYSKRYQAQQDRLSFYTPNYQRTDVAGFTSPNIRVFDTTYDGNTQLLVNFPIVNSGGSYTVRLPADRGAVMYAVADSALLQSPSVTFNNPSTLSSPNNATDMIIISFSATDFMTVAEQWANYRRSSTGGGFRVKVVDIADVYDEFSYGSQSANAASDFLAYADAYWQAPAPRYVLLIGDASYDPRNYEGYGDWDLVPSKPVTGLFEEAVSDDAMVPDLDHDNVPDMAIGRIPARSSMDITGALNKTILFETPANLDFGRGAVCAYDIGRDYQETCLAYLAHMPQGTPITYVNAREDQAHAHILSALNSGPFLANYTGHGGAAGWGPTGFFSTDDVPGLFNVGHPSIYTMLTCQQGYFFRPVADSLAESLVKAPNAAVAAWAGSLVDPLPDVQRLLGDRFYEQIALGQIRRLGDLTIDARTHIVPPGSESEFSWILLGDPALKIRP